MKQKIKALWVLLAVVALGVFLLKANPSAGSLADGRPSAVGGLGGGFVLGLDLAGGSAL